MRELLQEAGLEAHVGHFQSAGYTDRASIAGLSAEAIEALTFLKKPEKKRLTRSISALPSAAEAAPEPSGVDTMRELLQEVGMEAHIDSFQSAGYTDRASITTLSVEAIEGLTFLKTPEKKRLGRICAAASPHAQPRNEKVSPAIVFAAVMNPIVERATLSCKELTEAIAEFRAASSAGNPGEPQPESSAAGAGAAESGAVHFVQADAVAQARSSLVAKEALAEEQLLQLTEWLPGRQLGLLYSKFILLLNEAAEAKLAWDSSASLAVNEMKVRANIMFQQQRYDEAAQLYTDAILLCPSSEAQLKLVLYNNRANANLSLQKYAEAIGDASAVLEAEPRNAKALFRRACASRGLERWVEAAADFKVALRLEPSNTVVQTELKLAVAELSAAEAADVERAAAEAVAARVAALPQAERCAGLRVGSLEAGKHPQLRGVFTRDNKDPDANRRPHWSTAEGGHLYYSTDGRWYLSTEFTPDKLTCTVSFQTAGEVPTGEAAWRCLDFSLKDTDGTMGKWVDRTLTVAELSAADVAEAQRAAEAEAAALVAADAQAKFVVRTGASQPTQACARLSNCCPSYLIG
jgi:tetratricopeptide (TPR) repeat protein